MPIRHHYRLYMRIRRRRFSPVFETSSGNAFSHFSLVYLPTINYNRFNESMHVKLSYDMAAIIIVLKLKMQ